MSGREIKFRVWDAAERKWAQDWIALSGGRWVSDHTGEAISSVLEPNRLAPCQFTGLKDRNGADIYEGDILSMVDWGGHYTVRYERGSFGLYRDGRYIRSVSDAADTHIVVGNIYENADLIAAA